LNGSTVAQARAIVAGWPPGELRWLLGFDRYVPVDPLELAVVVDGFARAERLASIVAAWAAAEREDPARIDVEFVAGVVAAAGDWYRATHSDAIAGAPAAPTAPAELDDVEPFGRLLALAAASGIAVEWRSLPHAFGLAQRSSTGPVVLVRPGAGADVLAHELAHHFDPRSWETIGVAEREAFADRLGERLVASRVVDPMTARRLALDVVDELDVEPARASATPVALDVVERVLAVVWLEELAG
jgi:hypothetical protein